MMGPKRPEIGEYAGVPLLAQVWEQAGAKLMGLRGSERASVCLAANIMNEETRDRRVCTRPASGAGFGTGKCEVDGELGIQHELARGLSRSRCLSGSEESKSEIGECMRAAGAASCVRQART